VKGKETGRTREKVEKEIVPSFGTVIETAIQCPFKKFLFEAALLIMRVRL